jgi:hypothetical protein
MMNSRVIRLALVLCAVAGFATAQTERITRETTVENPQGEKIVTITGEVVRYEPGQSIVIREPDRKEVTFKIGPQATVPSEVQIGRKVTLTTQPAADGSGPAMVTRIETTSVTSEGQIKKKTETTETTASGDTSKTTTTTVYGTVTALQPGQSITIERPGHQTVTYTIDTQSEMPQDLAVGKTVTVTTQTVSGSGGAVVRKVTYRTVTKSKTKVSE